MLILSAYKNQGELFTLTSHLTREELSVLRNTSNFFCPQCRSPLRLKIGKIVIPHFAHIVLSDCLSSFSEKESPMHLLGKQQLAEFFQKAGCVVSVEAYLPKISQRPDLLIKKEKKSFAIEFQCSTINIEDVCRRNEGYSRAKIQSVWLPRTPPATHKGGVGIMNLKLTKFLQTFIYEDTISGGSLVTYEPSESRFVYITQLVHFGGTSFIGKVRSLPISDQTFPFARARPLNNSEANLYWDSYQQKRSRFLKNRIYTSKFGVRDRFLVNCYEQQILPSELPLYIGFPVKGSSALKDHPIEWQMALICALESQKVNIGQIAEEWIDRFLMASCKTYELEIARMAMRDYVSLLQILNYNPHVALSQQKVDEVDLKKHFHSLIVAKPCEN